MNIRTNILTGAVAGVLAAAAFLPLSMAQDAAPRAAAAAKPAAAQRTFATPEEAVAALVDAVRSKKVGQLVAIVGPGSAAWLFSGDKVADANDWQRFLAAYDEKNALEDKDDRTRVLDVGNDEWPFPAPIVKRASGWAFDAEAGRREILARRVGRNELDTIQTLLAIVDAEREYAATDADGNGFADYAPRFRSSPGKKDGLYWNAAEGEAQSPLGPLVAVASREGYGKKAEQGGKREPYHGYYYRILRAQGKHAPGGAYEYMVGGKLLGGFGVVAWPATYRVSGVMSFIVNHDGVVYEKDLGAQTASIASAMTRFEPDPTWRKSP